ncbi:inosine guanosine and [Sanghuangporus baumii]|uniref:purine-nucleoside phosphorylase n=1 Tax=Sanghuangporus baumii TaxID=108892 RepID=A0A9Q5HWM2_SANBA|nr:inosine guanosine and [Sanghuangporus baumii]
MSIKPLNEVLEATYVTIQSFVPSKLSSPEVGIVCGSGLSTLADSLRDVTLVPYDELEGFGKSTDHFAVPNLSGSLHPLLGPVTSPEHPRFLPLSNAYSPSLRRLAFLASHKLGLGTSALAEGVYAWVSGPTYETPAEGRFLRIAGADIVGMSTIPEVVVAREEGIEVMVLSLVTNMVVIPDRYRNIKQEVEAELAGKKVELPVEATVSHEEVLETGKAKAEVMRQLIENVIIEIPKL